MVSFSDSLFSSFVSWVRQILDNMFLCKMGNVLFFI